MIKDNKTAFDSFLFGRAALRLLVEWFMLWQFKNLFHSFVKFKAQRRLEDGVEEYTRFNILVITIVIVLWILGTVTSVISTFIYALY